jgi:hypothetical protein
VRGIRLVLTIDASAMAAILVLQSNRIGYFDPELDASFRCLAKFGRYWRHSGHWSALGPMPK